MCEIRAINLLISKNKGVTKKAIRSSLSFFIDRRLLTPLKRFCKMVSLAAHVPTSNRAMLAQGRFLLLHFFFLICYIVAETNGEPTKATTQMATRTTRYTTCGVYRYNVSKTLHLAESRRWNPVVAFFYIEDGLLDNVVAGIQGFLEKYAACGMSRSALHSWQTPKTRNKSSALET